MSLKLTGKWTEKYAGQTEIELEENTFVIPKSAFEYNDELKFIALPDSISIIYNSAFEKCESLEKLLCRNQLILLANEPLWIVQI